jgi:ComF family protein
LPGFLNIVYDFLSLIYPQVCAACGNSLYKEEKSLCTKCIYQIPKTNFHMNSNNEVAQLFWGRINLQKATAYYYYYKGSNFQKIIHRCKYSGHKFIGYDLGKLFAADLKRTWFAGIDVIHPVPLHYRKLRLRGFNQSEYIARGISEVLNKPLITDAVKREIPGRTQINKGKYDRWMNVENVFKVKNSRKLENKHVLLVDDVITTGSTMEACAGEILKCKNTQVSVASLAYAKINA